MQACDGIVQFIQMMQQGGGAPQQKAPQGEPVYRRGGKLVGYNRKKKKEINGLRTEEVYNNLYLLF